MEASPAFGWVKGECDTVRKADSEDAAKKRAREGSRLAQMVLGTRDMWLPCVCATMRSGEVWWVQCQVGREDCARHEVWDAVGDLRV